MVRTKVLFLSLLVCLPCRADESPKPFRFEIEAGPVWQGRNDVRIPNPGGTSFSLRDFRRGADFTPRFSLAWKFSENQELKALVFPFATKGTSQPVSPITFQGTTFNAGQTTESVYKFHSYRLTYRYHLVSTSPWSLKVGVTAKIRNARIALTQGGTTAEKTDVGFVPLLHVNGSYSFTEDFRVELDADALAAPQGRAEDISLFFWYRASPELELGGGYRTLEGGANNSKVFTFAWLHFLSATAALRF